MLGHDFAEEWTVDVEPTCTTEGSKSRHCSRCEEKSDVTVIDALGHDYDEWKTRTPATCTKDGLEYRACKREICAHEETKVLEKTGHSFSEWIVEKKETIFADGKKTRTCSKCSEKETVIIPKPEIDILTDSNYGIANFTVVDATTLVPIEGASIYISTETCGEDTVKTDENGKISVVLPVGRQNISVFANGYLTRNISVTIVNREQDIPLIGLGNSPLVDAKITHHEMTLDEIKEAGIDTSDPANQHVVRYEIKFEFAAEIDWFSMIAYFNLDGKCIGLVPVNSMGPGGPGGSDDGTDDPDDDGPGGGGSHGPGGGGGSHGSGGHRYSATLSDGTKFNLYPASEKFFLIVYGESHWLKEMYKVEMLIYNNSLTDSVEDCVAELTLPEGLSLAAMRDDIDSQNSIQSVGHIDPGGTELLHWYVKGDKEGSYDVTATLDGTLMPFEEKFHHEYVAQSPIKVYAGSALHMTFEVPAVTYYGEDYPIKITLENVSHKPIYNLTNVIYGLKQCRVTTYSDGSVEEYEVSSGVHDTKSKEVFNPGDKIVIEMVTNITFQSELIEHNLEQLCKHIDAFESLMNACKGFKAIYSISQILCGKVGPFIKFVNEVIDAAIDEAESEELAEKLNKYKELRQTLQNLKDNMDDSESKMLFITNEIKKADCSECMLELLNDPEALENCSEQEIDQLIVTVNRAVEECELEQAVEDFDIYESIKTAIMALPVRFVLKDVAVTSLENSTTEIPYSVKTTNLTSSKYFGVSDMGGYLGNLAKASAGEIDLPWWMNILGIEDDPAGYKETVKEIIATENEIKTFAAQSATGKTEVSAWIESSADAALSDENVKGEPSWAFKLSCENNETSYTDENGVLHFVGARYINVTPKSASGAKLHVRMEENGAVKETVYNITVVKQHTCSGSTWENIVSADKTSNGYSVMRCDVCTDIINVREDKFCLEHKYGGYVVEKEATDDADGWESAECGICGHKDYRSIPSYITGDINGDKIVDMNDAILLLQHSMFPNVILINYKGNTDYVKDGILDMNDAIFLLQHSMFPDLFPIS